MMPVIVIRPQPACDATVAAARGLGLNARGFALFELCPVAWEPPAPDDVDALLLGSANAVRYAGDALAMWHGRPVLAVGEATARAAREAGFAVIATGEGDLQGMLDSYCADAAPPPRLLRLCGRERTVLVPPPGVAIAERIVYASAPVPMPPGMARLLSGSALVLLHSASAAGHFRAQCDASAIDKACLSLAALSPRIAEVAGTGWAGVRAAKKPAEAALLALAGEMCQKRRH